MADAFRNANAALKRRSTATALPASSKVKSGEQECSPYTDKPGDRRDVPSGFLTIEPFGITNNEKDERWGSVLRG